MSTHANHGLFDLADANGAPIVPTPLIGVIPGALLIAGLTLAVYLPSLRGPFIIDDDRYLTENSLIASPAGLYGFWFTRTLEYYPVSNSSLWLEWRLWGMDPTGYHVTNLIFHIASSLLLWAILRRLLVPGGLLAALLFAIHPVNVQTVAWVAQRKEVLAAFFCMLSVLLYLLDEDQTAARTDRPGFQAGRWYGLSLFAFLLGILSKGTVGTLPLVLLLLMWWRRGGIGKSDFLRCLPFIGVGLVVSLVHVWWQMHGDPIAHSSFDVRLAGAGAVAWFYLSKALLPIDLSIVYAHWQIHTSDPRWWLPLIAAAMLTVVLWWNLKRRPIRAIFFAWVYFGLASAPILGIAETGGMKISLVADHYQHLALVGVVALVAAGLVSLSAMAGKNLWTKIPAVALVGILFALTWQRSSLFGDSVRLFDDALAKDPNSWLSHNNLGIALVRAGRADEAVPHFQQVLRLNPNFVGAENNLGVALLDQGKSKEAIDCFQQVLMLSPDDPLAHQSLGVAYFNLANSLQSAGLLNEAIENYQQALHFRADYAEAHYNLGVAFGTSGKMQQAIEQFQQCLRLQPNFAAAHNNLGNALFAVGRSEEALEQFGTARRLKPEDGGAYFNQAKALASLNRTAEAIAAAQTGMEVARSHAQQDLAGQIETWLKDYLSSQAKSGAKTTSSGAVETAP